MGLTALLATTLPLRAFYIVGGIVIAIGGLLVFRIPTDVGKRMETERRMILKGRYWLYYVLTFFEGSRMQVFGSFGTLILVQNYGLGARQISLLLVVSGIVNFLLAPRLGHLIDIVGERITLSASYVLLGAVLCRLCHGAQCLVPGGDAGLYQPAGDPAVSACPRTSGASHRRKS